MGFARWLLPLRAVPVFLRTAADPQPMPRRRGRIRVPVASFVAAAIGGDLAAAEAIAAEYLAASGSQTAVVNDLLGAAEMMIARRWLVGEATSADEYAVSQAIESTIRALPPRPPAPTDLVRPQAFLATLRPEEHHLGLELVAIVLGDEGWDVKIANSLDVGELAEEVARGNFRIVAISCTYAAPHSTVYLTSAVRAVHTLGRPVIVGGQAFARDRSLSGTVGADLHAADPRTAAVVARRYHSREWRRRSRRRAPGAG